MFRNLIADYSTQVFKRDKGHKKMKTAFSYVKVATDDQRILAIDELLGE